MNPALRVLKNSSALTISAFLERGIAFLLPLYVARIMGREIWGDFSTAQTFVAIAANLSTWGLIGLLPRKIARSRDHAGKLFLNSTFIGTGITIILMFLTVLVVYLLNYSPSISRLIYTGVFLVLLPQTEANLYEAAILGLEHMEWMVMVRFPITNIRVAVSIYMLSIGYEIEILFLTQGLFYLTSSILYTIIFIRHVPDFRFEFDRQLITLLFIQSAPFFIIISVSETLGLVDRIILSKLWSTDAVGIYTTGIMFIQLIYLIAPAIMNALFPGLSRTYISSSTRFSFLVSWIFKIMTVLIFPVMLLTIASSEWLIPFVFGSQYDSSITVMQIAALGILPSYLSRVLYRSILASDNERAAVKATIISGALSLLLNILLIPTYGVVGAAIASVGTILANLTQYFWHMTKIIRFDYKHALLIPSICVVLSMITYILMINWNHLAALAIALIVFTIAVVVTKTINQEDIKMLMPSREK